jgi:putative transcriptional regulator
VERDWSQAELAERLEVSRQTVNAVETGKYDPSLPLAFKIARVFGLSIEAIFDPGNPLACSRRPTKRRPASPRDPARSRVRSRLRVPIGPRARSFPAGG